jgi:hypothetical protein
MNVEDEVRPKEEVTFDFPIIDPTTIVQMKNIPPSALPHFHGMVSEDPNAFIFEFYILCHSYDYSNDDTKTQNISYHPQIALNLVFVYGVGRKYN